MSWVDAAETELQHRESHLRVTSIFSLSGEPSPSIPGQGRDVPTNAGPAQQPIGQGQLMYRLLTIA